MNAGVQVVINAKAGGKPGEISRQDFTRTIHAVFPGAGMVFIDKGTDISQLVKKAMEEGARLVVAGGGDGTVSAVASVLARTETAMGVLPLGTLNHFARDLGLPVDLEAAVQVLKTGRIKAVDVGEVNGRVFINNSSLGLYPRIVVFREEQGRGMPKWPVALVGLLESLVCYRLLTIRIHAQGRELLRTTPVVFVGNNEYAMEGLNAGSRAALDSGRLHLIVSHEQTRTGLILFSLLTLLGYRPQGRGFDAMHTDELLVESRHARLRVSTDGEVTVMNAPLHYRILPGALKVVCPEKVDA